MSRTKRHIIGAAVALVLALVVGLVTGEGPLLLGDRDAHAVIGRPLTPMSYAGVARRTTRRAAYAGAYTGAAYGAYYAPPPVHSTTVVTTLPAGCVQSGGTYVCGGASYAPAYNGTTVVYQQM